MKHRQLSTKLLLALLILCGLTAARATPLQQSYEDRPSIFEIASEPSYFDDNWESIKKAQLIFIAQILELYPNKQLYFLARDGEYLFDLAQLVTENSRDAERIHLINVSRANMRERNFREYLAQEGISEESLLAGKEILLVDSGYVGSIPDHIKFQFSDKASRNIQAQFILSRDPKIPYSRAFLLFLNSSAHRLDPQTSNEVRDSFLAYERLEKETRRSTHFKKINGRYHPMSPLKDARSKSSFRTDQIIAAMQASENTMVDPIVAQRRRADLKYYWNQREAQEFFFHIRKMMRSLHKAFVTGNSYEFRDIMAKAPPLQASLLKAITLDAREILKSQKHKLMLTKAELLRKENRSEPPMCKQIFL